MLAMRWITALCGFVLVAACAMAEEAPAKPIIERPPIQKEPAYQSKAPQYGLLVFGQTPPKGLWVVLDGETLYVDRNANGDLTERGEQIRVSVSDGGPSFAYSLGVLPDGEVKPCFSDLSFSLKRRWSLEQPNNEPVTIRIGTKDPKAFPIAFRPPNFGVMAVASGVLSRKPQDAPIIWFDGPLEMKLNAAERRLLVRGDELGLSVAIGTFVSENAERTLTMYEVPADVHPLVEIEYPAPPGGKPVLARYLLKKR